MWDHIIPQPSVIDPIRAQELGWAIYGFYEVIDSKLFWVYVTNVWSRSEQAEIF